MAVKAVDSKFVQESRLDELLAQAKKDERWERQVYSLLEKFQVTVLRETAKRKGTDSIKNALADVKHITDRVENVIRSQGPRDQFTDFIRTEVLNTLEAMKGELEEAERDANPALKSKIMLGIIQKYIPLAEGQVAEGIEKTSRSAAGLKQRKKAA